MKSNALSIIYEEHALLCIPGAITPGCDAGEAAIL